MERSKRRILWILVALIVLGALWYAFRPEKLFINKQVDEPPPTGASQ